MLTFAELGLDLFRLLDFEGSDEASALSRRARPLRRRRAVGKGIGVLGESLTPP